MRSHAPRQTQELSRSFCSSGPRRCRWYTPHLRTPLQICTYTKTQNTYISWYKLYFESSAISNKETKIIYNPCCYCSLMPQVLPPTADHVSPPVGAVLDSLGVNLTAAHVFDTERQPLSISDLGLSHSLQVGLLHLGVVSPHDLPAGVHRHGRLLPTQLTQRGRGDTPTEAVLYDHTKLLLRIKRWRPLFCLRICGR